MHIVFIQPLLPKYAIEFFNQLSSKSDLKITVLADLESKSQLNQVSSLPVKFNVINLQEKEVGPFKFRPKLRDILSSLEYDHIIFNANPRDISQLLTMILFSIKRKEFNSWSMFHRIGGKKLYSELYYKLIGHLSKKCFSYSKTGVLSQINRGVNQCKLVELGTAIDELKVISERKKRTDEEINFFREENNLVGKKIVLQVVRLSKIKKPALLIDAAEKILKIDKNVIFVLIGGGELEDNIRQNIKKRNLNDNVLVLGPIYDEEILSYWFMVADVFVIPTCIGLSAHHAMCYSLPIITDNDYQQQASEFDVLSDNINALLYQHGNIDSLSDKILMLLGNENYKKFIGDNSYYTVTQIYNMKNKVNNLLSAFDIY
ncbi:TPA: glycosyltransferase [Photobacterium damselae]